LIDKAFSVKGWVLVFSGKIRGGFRLFACADGLGLNCAVPA